MNAPPRVFSPAPQANPDVPTGVQPVQSVAMALLREHDLINSAKDSMGTYRVLMNHLSWELPMIRAVFAPWNYETLKLRTKMSQEEVKEARNSATALEDRLNARRHAHHVKVHTQPVPGGPGEYPKYLVSVTDPERPTMDPPLIVYENALPGVLQVKHESQKEDTFESAVIELFEIHMKGHNLLADVGELDLSTQISNLRGYSRSDFAKELAETVAARREGEVTVSPSPFANDPPRRDNAQEEDKEDDGGSELEDGSSEPD